MTKVQKEVFVEYKVKLYKIQIKYVNSLGVLYEIEVYRKLYSYYFFEAKRYISMLAFRDKQLCFDFAFALCTHAF